MATQRRHSPRQQQRQQKILEFVREFLDDNGYPPTIRDICHGCGISSTSVVDYNLKILEGEGFLRRDREVSRGIELVGQGISRSRNLLRVPVLGNIAAGIPIDIPDPATWDLDGDVVEVDPSFVRGKALVFALRVKGHSMIDALIDDGDLVFLEPAEKAETGQIIAARLTEQNETTLKKFYQEGPRIRLQPCNPTMDPIYVDADKVQIHGRLLTVMRGIA